MDLTAVLCTATCENGVNVRFLQQQIMVGTNLGQQSVIECNDAVFQRIAGSPVCCAITQGEVIGSKTAYVDHSGLGNRAELEPLEHRSRSCQRLWEADRLRDADGVFPPIEFKPDHTAVQEILGKAFILRSIMRRRQPNGKLNVHQPIRDILARRVDLVSDGEQRQDKKSVVLCFIPGIGDSLVGERVVFSPIK